MRSLATLPGSGSCGARRMSKVSLGVVRNRRCGTGSGGVWAILKYHIEVRSRRSVTRLGGTQKGGGHVSGSTPRVRGLRVLGRVRRAKSATPPGLPPGLARSQRPPHQAGQRSEVGRPPGLAMGIKSRNSRGQSPGRVGAILVGRTKLPAKRAGASAGVQGPMPS